MKGTPFARVNQLMALAAAAISALGQGASPMLRQQAHNEVMGGYKSRGHGGKHPTKRTGIAAFRRGAAKRRNVLRNRRAHK